MNTLKNRQPKLGKRALLPITEHQHIGVTPARQVRSEATFQALVQAGRAALESGGLDKVSIGELARLSNTSVGAFYGRFENKEVFFTVVQQIALDEVEKSIRQTLDALDRKDASVTSFLKTIARLWVTLFRENRGLYRATFERASMQPAAWEPIKQLGQVGATLIADKLVPRLTGEGKACNEMQVHIAAQFVNGLLVNATINDPGPIRLDDPEMLNQVFQFLCLYLGVTSSSENKLGTTRPKRKTL